jgi:hypothetical protein
MRKLINETSFDSRVLTGIPVVLAVVDAGSFIGAGNALGLRQSGVSRAIQRLEQRLGVRLFERNAKVMRLTDIGKQFSSPFRRTAAFVVNRSASFPNPSPHLCIPKISSPARSPKVTQRFS